MGNLRLAYRLSASGPSNIGPQTRAYLHGAGRLCFANMKTYRITHVEKTVCRDWYETGCEIEQRRVLDEKLRLSAPSFKALVLMAKEWAMYLNPEDDYVFMPNGVEDDYFGFNQLEDDNDEPVDGTDDDFKSGKRYYWLADYTFHFEIVEKVSLTEADLEGLKIG